MEYRNLIYFSRSDECGISTYFDLGYEYICNKVTHAYDFKLDILYLHKSTCGALRDTCCYNSRRKLYERANNNDNVKHNFNWSPNTCGH